MARSLAVVVAAGLPACYSPDAAPGAPCSAGLECPAGQSCDLTAPGGPTCVREPGTGGGVDGAPVPICSEAACPAGYLKIEGGCYRVVTTPRAWLAAELDCESQGGHLLVTDDVDEHFVIHALAAGVPRIWIGWTDRRSQDNVFVWVAPSAGGFRQNDFCVFGAGEPDAGDADHCVAALGDNACPDHSDESCELALPYVCECDGNAADRTAY
ncbi:MAG: C-type lectin domain-containing protein [Deltaproteobacteria bacterium]|nr:C-type lectin domain-containing protein [Deltaproteobacteria bacterium]